jgi:transcriptional regulator with XRE-family HTH domain
MGQAKRKETPNMYKITDAELRKRLGKKLKLLRLKREKTQVELATAMGMTSTGAVSQVENGSKGLRPLAILNAADFLEVSTADLIIPDDLDEVEVKLRVGLERLIRRRRKDAKSVASYIDALIKLLSN